MVLLRRYNRSPSAMSHKSSKVLCGGHCGRAVSCEIRTIKSRSSVNVFFQVGFTPNLHFYFVVSISNLENLHIASKFWLVFFCFYSVSHS